MRRMSLCGGLAAALALLSTAAYAGEFAAELSGYQELGGLNAQTGAIFTPGTGELKLDLDTKTQSIVFELTYSGLTSAVLQSHIHFGKARDSGGIIASFCTNKMNGPTGTKTCPTPSGTVTGTITAASVVADTGQNVNAGDFSAVLGALESNTAYVNVHTVNFPGGEIRGQIRKVDKDHKGD
jgi:hypothetical protein